MWLNKTPDHRLTLDQIVVEHKIEGKDIQAEEREFAPSSLSLSLCPTLRCLLMPFKSAQCAFRLPCALTERRLFLLDELGGFLLKFRLLSVCRHLGNGLNTS
ncbi:hypothetical protein F7725_017887 [Dissostichus mawsoni]|uniref:Uncharacterized protein n=1 Tax=Dissostichus mawsoni TaxID=36200 RepID=A0A7J5XQ60_DISMA|nr:hypothetical protein F7725_017887 [Dissostichus mawsoni]